MKQLNILGIKVDDVSAPTVLDMIHKFIVGSKKAYIVTPNPEMIVDAQTDEIFKKALNGADLSIPDGVGLLAASRILALKSKFSSTNLQISHKESNSKFENLSLENSLKMSKLFSLKIENCKLKIPYSDKAAQPLGARRYSEVPEMLHLHNRVTGTDLMLEICRLAEEKGFAIGLLGGLSDVAEKCSKRLKQQYPKLNIVYVKGDIKVDNEGKSVETVEKMGISTKSPFDILFVAFGHKKQEKWIYQNLDSLPIKIAIGVGGAFDYIAGVVPRAPKLLRSLGLEWLFRLIIQPWRIKRQTKLLKFIWMCVVK